MKQFIKFLPLMVIAFLFFAATALAEKVTFVKEYNYNASDLDSKVSSRAIALEQVKRLLLEELGTYLISETEVKNFRLSKDQVTTYSAGVVSAEVVDEKWDGKTYYLKAKVSADPAEVAKSLQNIANDKQKSKELEDVRKKAAEFSKEIERLKKELAIAKTDTKKPEQKADTKKIGQYNEAVKGLSATDWFENGNVYFDKKQYDRAIADYSKAIQLDPNDAMAYYNRGIAYYFKGQYDRAIADYNKGIALDPNNAIAYNYRGIAYDFKGQYDKAFKDYNKAIQLDPNYVFAYSNRGIAYKNKGQYDRAFKDYNKAIQLDSNYAQAYYNRGIAYHSMGKNQEAFNDYKIAAKLGFKPAQDYLRSQGIGW